ncbi:class I SAM-dependent methyltransferase [Parvibium lacunae]|uniref:Class I SAM-dependent methyltransferase n=1 Tax=Parvibium lacunae TaxID=1888893 RepID=A0A368L4B9_9BURK|nr:class I SAM-dependent methyltransferase [Parvibium lacunae]RCS58417.1 class I SAM-dependent methyltransferase [Parvibium lacunae]
MSRSLVDSLITFRNSQGESVRATLMQLQRKSLVLEVYNPYSIVQVSEVLAELTIRIKEQPVYCGRAVVISMVNTGLTAVVSVTLIDEWQELADDQLSAENVGKEVRKYIGQWSEGFQIRPKYQLIVNELRAFLSDMARWVEQVDLSNNLPKENNQLRQDYFFELASPFIERTNAFLSALEGEAREVPKELISQHHAFSQGALHPLMLRAPFVFRTYTKPLGYAGDYEMVNQLLADPRQGPNTYFQIINSAFLQAAVAQAHRNRIDILVDFLKRLAVRAEQNGRPLRILNVGCGPAVEVQRFIQTHHRPELLNFELLDFSEETLKWTRSTMAGILQKSGRPIKVSYLHESVHQLLKRSPHPHELRREYDAVYCAGLFDYLSDKVCHKLLTYFTKCAVPGGQVLFTNVHSNNPEKVFVMESLLEWYLIYRDEQGMSTLIPEHTHTHKVYADHTGVNVFGEFTVN